MARGKEQHDERVAQLQRFGKDLARRARSRCELCERGGLPLSIVEVPPQPGVPDFDHCVMLCEACARAVASPKQFEAGQHWRCLAQTVWSETPAVQVLALRLLRRQALTEAWARETLEIFYVDDDIEDWVTKAK